MQGVIQKVLGTIGIHVAKPRACRFPWGVFRLEWGRSIADASESAMKNSPTTQRNRWRCAGNRFAGTRMRMGVRFHQPARQRGRQPCSGRRAVRSWSGWERNAWGGGIQLRRGKEWVSTKHNDAPEISGLLLRHQRIDGFEHSGRRSIDGERSSSRWDSSCVFVSQSINLFGPLASPVDRFRTGFPPTTHDG